MRKQTSFQRYLELRTAGKVQLIVNTGKVEKTYICRICGEIYKSSEEEIHESKHSTIPVINNGQKYFLTTDYNFANTEMSRGEKVFLLLNYYKNKFVETHYLANLLPDNYTLFDYFNTKIKYKKAKNIFVKVLFLIVITLILK